MEKRKPYIYFYEHHYKYKGYTIEEQVKAFKKQMKKGIYHTFFSLEHLLQEIKKEKFQAYKKNCDFDDYGCPAHVIDLEEAIKLRESWVPIVNPKPEEEQGIYKILMSCLELKELAEEFIKEDPKNFNFISIIKAANEIFSYVPKDEYDKVYSMYHRLYYGSELNL